MEIILLFAEVSFSYQFFIYKSNFFMEKKSFFEEKKSVINRLVNILIYHTFLYFLLPPMPM